MSSVICVPATAFAGVGMTSPFVVSLTVTAYSFALNVTFTVTFDAGIINVLSVTVIAFPLASSAVISSLSKPSFGVTFISICSPTFGVPVTLTVPLLVSASTVIT